MADFPALPLWTDAQQLRDELSAEGWLTPDTYTRLFAEPPPAPAIYLFLLCRRPDLAEAIVAYVGMSLNLHQRWTGHPVLTKLQQTDHWTMRWFKPSAPNSLRAQERLYIQQFDPPWNIAGRRRGVALP